MRRFFMQGIFSANLLYLYLQSADREERAMEKSSSEFIDKDKIFSLIGSLFFIMAPVF